MGERSSHPENQTLAENLAQKASGIFREILPKAEGNIGRNEFITASYEDSLGRQVEVRLIQNPDDPTFFTLNANIGDPLALIELKGLLEKKGLPIKRLVAYFADPDTQQILVSFSSKK